MIWPRVAIDHEMHEQYAGKPLHTGYCNKMMQNVNKWDRCLYEPSEEVLSRAEEACEKLESKDESVDRHYWQAVAGDQLPQLLAEIERLRADQDAIMAAWDKDAVEHDARIKELEADRIEARAQYLLFMNDNPGCIAWNFDELDETEQDALREQARYMLELEEPWAYVQLREAREQIKRLEAAFLKAEKANLMHHMDADYADENAREALERIKEGGKSA